MSQKLFDFWTKIFFWSDFFSKWPNLSIFGVDFFARLVTRLFFVSKKPFSERTWPSLSSRFFTFKLRKTQFRGQSLSPLSVAYIKIRKKGGGVISILGGSPFKSWFCQNFPLQILWWEAGIQQTALHTALRLFLQNRQRKICKQCALALKYQFLHFLY